MIDAGTELIQKMDEYGYQPDAAFWLYSSEQQKWKLVLSEIKVGEEGPKQVYQRIQKILSGSPKILGKLSLEDISLVKPSEPIVLLLAIAIRTGPGINGIRFTNNVINGVLIEDAYIYRII